MQKVLEPIQRVRFTKCTLRHASIRGKKGPAGDKCLFPHHKVDEQPNKKPKKGYHSQKKKKKATTTMLLLFVNSVPQVGCVSQDSESLDSQ